MVVFYQILAFDEGVHESLIEWRDDDRTPPARIVIIGVGDTGEACVEYGRERALLSGIPLTYNVLQEHRLPNGCELLVVVGTIEDLLAYEPRCRDLFDFSLCCVVAIACDATCKSQLKRVFPSDIGYETVIAFAGRRPPNKPVALMESCYFTTLALVETTKNATGQPCIDFVDMQYFLLGQRFREAFYVGARGPNSFGEAVNALVNWALHSKDDSRCDRCFFVRFSTIDFTMREYQSMELRVREIVDEDTTVFGTTIGYDEDEPFDDMVLIW